MSPSERHHGRLPDQPRRVAVGFFSFTEVPASAHESYNAWHQLDHLPEQYALPGIAHGERWVASPDCVAARIVDGELLGRAQYVTLYLLGDPVESTIDAFGRLAGKLREVGRFYEERTALLAGSWRLAQAATSPHLPISPGVIPWRPARGVFVLVEHDLDDQEPPALDPLVGVEGVAGGWTFVPGDPLTRSWWVMWPYRISVLWLDGDPLETTARLEPALRARWRDEGATPVLAGPLRTITPGEWTWFAE
jgi:hypothetical protein